MDPRDAAVAFAADHIDKDLGSFSFKIDDRNAKPPTAGEIGLRWESGNYWAPPAEGLTILNYDGHNSKLLLSEVEIVGRPSSEEIKTAVMKTDSYPVSRLVAKQTYEIIWWLRHVRHATEPTGNGRRVSFLQRDL